MLREKIKNGEKTIGMHVNLSDIAAAKIAGCAGFDFVWVDLEHSYLSYETVLAHIIALRSTGTDAIVRVPVDDLTATKKVLEMGPAGIIFPMVRSAEQVNRQIADTLYPPLGTRGFGPMNAADYGFRDEFEFTRRNHEELCRFIQIEHIDAVKHIDEILQNPWIDGYIFGPNDLSGSIGELGNPTGANTEALIREAIQKLKAAGKYVGVSTGSVDERVLTYWHSLGVDMLSAGADYGFLVNGIRAQHERLTRIHKQA